MILPLCAADFSNYTTSRLRKVKTEADLQSYRATQHPKFLTEARNAACPHIIISAEHLHGFVRLEQEIGRVRDFLAPLGARVVVFLYLRRPDDFATSWYAERVRTGYAGDLDRLVEHDPLTRHLLDYAGAVDGWASIFGGDNIALRVYDRRRLHGGNSISDFLHNIGVSEDFISQHRSEIDSDVRKGLGADAIAFLVRFNARVEKMARPDMRLLAYLRSSATRELIAQCLESNESARPFRLSPATRRQLIDRFAESNHKLFARYGIDGFDDFISDELTNDTITLETTISFAASLWLGLQRDKLANQPR